MKNFDDMANRIRVDVLPDPAPASMEDDDDSEDDDDDDDMDDDESGKLLFRGEREVRDSSMSKSLWQCQ